MSRKKKKKEKQIRDRQQITLGGWDNADGKDDIDDIDDDDEQDEGCLAAETAEAAAAEPAVFVEPKAEPQIVDMAQKEPELNATAEWTKSESEAVLTATPQPEIFAAAKAEPEAAVAQPQPEPEATAAVQPRPRLERSAAQPKPERQAADAVRPRQEQRVADAAQTGPRTKPPPPPRQRPEQAVRQEQAAYAKPEPQARAAGNAAPKATAKPKAGGLMQRFAAMKAARLANKRTSEELAEDNEKFGGLEDDSVADSDQAAVERTLYNLKQVVAEQKKSIMELSQKMSAPAKKPLRKKSGKDANLGEMGQLADWCHTEFYYLGVQLIRYQSDIRRLLFQMFVWVKYTVPPFFSRKRTQVVRYCDRIADSCLDPFKDMSSKTRAFRYNVDHREESPQKGGIVGMSARYVYSLGRPINRAVSFLLPILGCAILTAVILYFQQLNYALEVEYAGRNLGYVQTESDFYDARDRMNERLRGEEYIPADDSRPTFRLVIAAPGDYESVDSLANKLLAMSQNNVTTADGIYVDNTFLGAVEDGNEFLLYIDGVLQGYRTGIEHEKVQFVKKVAVQKAVYPVSAMRPVYAIKADLETNSTMPRIHTVAKDDTLESIAEQYDTTPQAIISLNSRLQERAEKGDTDDPSLVTDEEIMVSQVALSLGIQVTRRETYTEKLDYDTEYKDDNRYPKTYEEIISNGVAGKQEVVADVVYVDGKQIGETRVSVTVTREPVNERKMRGTLSPLQYLPAGSDTDANFRWPVAGGYISCGLYGYRGHTGTDIAANLGTGIYAARSGTVSAAYSYINGSLGKHVFINHGNGVTTVYAHCSEVMVKAGQYVRQGQLIAKVGRTGNATGNHLHFEIRINGRIMNPVDFIGSRYPG